MTFLAGVWDANSKMGGIGCLVIGRLVAGKTGIRGCGIISVMTDITIPCNGLVRPGQRVIVTMYGECGRGPSGICGMTFLAGIWDTGRLVAGIGSLVINRFMAAEAVIGSAGIITVVAGCAIVGDGNMSTCQRIIVAVNRESGRGPAWIGGVAICAGIWNSYTHVVWVRCLYVNAIMTITADHGGTLITILMA
jgi:hypothetical protein